MCYRCDVQNRCDVQILQWIWLFPIAKKEMSHDLIFCWIIINCTVWLFLVEILTTIKFWFEKILMQSHWTSNKSTKMLIGMMRTCFSVVIWWHFSDTGMRNTLVTQIWEVACPLGTHCRHICQEIYMTEGARPSYVIWITSLILQIIDWMLDTSRHGVEYMCC